MAIETIGVKKVSWKHSASRLVICLVILSAPTSSQSAVDFGAMQAALSEKKLASEVIYPNETVENIQLNVVRILESIDKDFQISLSENGVSGNLAWSSYMVMYNISGRDYWSISIEKLDNGISVKVNATTKSFSGLVTGFPAVEAIGVIPLDGGSGLSVDEMNLFHRRLSSLLAGGAIETCKQAFGGRKKKYPLTCGRGGATYTVRAP